MLSHEDNEKLVRVGKGTPLGELFRLYWIPFLPSKDLAKDGQPKRIRLLGEDLVAFRDSEGRIGLVDQACPHRGAPLIFGRNEDCGLRCVYHGWKFDVAGAVTDMPAEPARSRLKEHVRIKAYPCQERNGMIWTYMGPDADNLPPLPNLEWNLVPADQVHVSVRVQECNWLQAVEGEIDSAHAPLLHGRLGRLAGNVGGRVLTRLAGGECAQGKAGQEATEQGRAHGPRHGKHGGGVAQAWPHRRTRPVELAASGCLFGPEKKNPAGLEPHGANPARPEGKWPRLRLGGQQVLAEQSLRAPDS